MPVTVQQFVSRLAKNGLVGDDELDALSPKNNLTSDDARQLAKQLVDQGRLSVWQARMLLIDKGGPLILGNYLLVEKIGQGGMGTVFKARHRRMQRTVALKVLPSSLARDSDALKRFHREIRAAARLEHPNVVTAYDADEAGGVNFLVMQFIDGCDLSRLVRRSGRLAIDEALTCIAQAADGLQHAHEAGIIHRDLKPSNLLVDREGTVRILDLGLARLSQGEAREATLTQSGTVMGTADYMAPEQSRNAADADERSDIYSLGCTLYFLLTGQVPFPGGSVVEKVLRHQLEEPAAVRQLRPEVSDRIAEVVAQLMSKDPADRIQTAGEVATTLQGLTEYSGSRVQLSDDIADPPDADFSTAPSRTDPAPPFRAALEETLLGPVESQGDVSTTISGVSPVVGRRSQERLNKKLLRVTVGSALLLVAALTAFLITARPTDNEGGGGTAGNDEDGNQKGVEQAGDGRNGGHMNGGRKASSALVAAGWQIDFTLTAEIEAADVYDISLTKDSRFVAVACGVESIPNNPGIVQVWDLTNHSTAAVLRTHKKIVQCARFSPDNRTLASAAGDWDHPVPGVVKLWNVVRKGDAISFEERKSFQAHENGVMSLCFHPQSRKLATASRDHTIKIWDAQTGKLLQTLNGHSAAVDWVTYSPDGQWLASGGADKTVKLWQPLRSDEPISLNESTLCGWISQVTFSPDGKRLAAATGVPDGGEAVLAVWDVESRRRIAHRTHGGIHVYSLAFTPDGESLISGCQDGVLRFWDARLQKPPRALETGEAGVFFTTFSHDRLRMLTACGDSRLVVWKPAGKK